MDASILFADIFSAEPERQAFAPGRVEVLGNHTDYNEGYVLSCAVDRGIRVAVGRSGDAKTSEFVSSHFQKKVSVDSDHPLPENSWVNYPLGVWVALRDAGYPVEPFRITVTGDIPLGAGLSSSAALEVATGLALSALFGFSVDDVALAKLCRKAENEFVGTNCGLLDQFTSVFGKRDHLLFTDFRSLDHRTVRLPGDDVCLAVTVTGVTHSLVESAYNDRREECYEAAKHFGDKNSSVTTLRDISMSTLESAKNELDPVVYRRAKHVVGEDERVLHGIELLERGGLESFGRLLFESHESSRVNFENSCEELDVLVDEAKGIDGVYGARVTGGGFGGATLTLLKDSAKDLFASRITQAYKKRTGWDTTVYFAQIGEGARVL